MIRNASDRFLRAAALPVVLVLAFPSVAVASPEMDEAKQLYQEGSSLYSAADYNGAIDKFTKALTIVQSEGGDAENMIRGDLLLNIAQSHVHAYEVDADVGHLRMARSISERLVDEADRGVGYAEADVDDAKQQIDKLDADLAELEKAEPAPPTEASPTPPPATADNSEVDILRTRNLGIGLLVGGVVLAGGGGGLIGFGTTYRPHALDEIKDQEGDLPFDDYSDNAKSHVSLQTERGQYIMALGGGLIAIGIVGIAIGAARLGKAAKMKKAQNTALLTPVFSRDLAGLSLAGRF